MYIMEIFITQCFHNKISINQPILVKLSENTYSYICNILCSSCFTISIHIKNTYKLFWGSEL